MKVAAFLNLLILLSWHTSPTVAAPRFAISQLGFSDAEHTTSVGYQNSVVERLNDNGQARGYSYRYNGGDSSLGQSVWLYDGSNNLNVGLTGPEHTASNGTKISGAAGELITAGQVIGTSSRFNGATSAGGSAWFFDGVNTRDISLAGYEYTRNDGWRHSSAVQLNESGQVLGISEQYNGGSVALGHTFWLYDGTTTISLGLTGPEFTWPDGTRSNFARELNEAGQIIGHSKRFITSTRDHSDLAAWLYDGTKTIEIGLTGAEYTRNDGHRYSNVVDLNEVGQVAGYSERFNGGNSDRGQTAWLYDGTHTVDISLTDPEHTRNDGYRYSDSYGISDAGKVFGASARFNNGSSPGLGQTAWLYDGTSTINIGLTDAEHTASNGHRSSAFFEINDAGQLRGTSKRFNGGSDELGDSALFYDGSKTRNISVATAEYTRNDGYQLSAAEGLNEAGQVRGYSTRYNNGTTQLGQDAWIYDSTLDQTYLLQLSMRSDGFAFSEVNYLGDDGLALGNYTLFDEFDNTLGKRAFYFTIADGLHDLGSLVGGGLSANGWESLAFSIHANAHGQIVGEGKRSGQLIGQTAFLLTPIVPEPNGLTFAICLTFGVACSRWQVA